MGIARILFGTAIIFTLLTLVKDYPPYRLYLVDFALVPMLLVTIFQRMSLPSRLRIRWQGIDTLFILFALSVLLAFMFSENTRQSAVTFIDWIRIILFYFLCRMLFQKQIQDKTLFRVFTLGSVILIVIGLIQLVTNSSFGLIGNYFGLGNAQGVEANVAGFGSRARVSGTTSNPIIFAMWVTLFALIVAARFNYRGRTILFFAVTGAGAVVVLSTLSRGAIAAFALTWLIFVFMNRKQLVRNVVYGSVLLVMAMPLAYLGLQESLIADVAEMVEARIERQELLEEDSGRVKVFRIAQELLKEPKIFMVGTGPDNMMPAYNKFGEGVSFRENPNVVYQRSGVHNVWMKVFVEYGVASFVLFVLIWLSILRHTYRLWKQHRFDERARLWASIGFAFFIPYILIDSMVYESAMTYHIYIPLFALVAWLVTQNVTMQNAQREARAA
ncbi:MAG: O-antigen ligase family protein [Pseudomonadota bacterium]